MKMLLAIFVGGGLGCMLRYGISIWGNKLMQFPLGTFLSNLLASALLVGFTYFLGQRSGQLSQVWKGLLLIGFCGGFSTFSTFSLETFQLWKSGQTTLAILNVFVSVAACLLAIGILSKIWPNQASL